MSYTPPVSSAADFTWQTEAAYTPPAGSAANLAWAPDVPAITLAAVVPLVAAMALGHDGVVVESAIAATVSITAALSLAHGVSANIAATVPIIATASLTVERYELKGEVRIGGMLVERRVRAYLRSTGVLVAEADTAVGKFNLPTGFGPQEYYVTPIDLGADATDWLPPTANRVTSVLASDT